MAERQTQNSEFQPSEVNAIRMAVIEYRENGYPNWSIWETYGGCCLNVAFLRERCKCLAIDFPDLEFRYRHGTLTLDLSDECETFRSE